MGRRILIIQGHPDPHEDRYGHALEGAYAEGAWVGGHEIERLRLAHLQMPLVRSRGEWEKGELGADIRKAQELITWAQHIVLFYPLWLGSMPALLKAFLEQVLRPGFAVNAVGAASSWKGLLRGRSARVVVTMSTPAALYRWYFRAHSVKSLRRNILGLAGIRPIHETLVGSVETSESSRKKGLEEVHALGRSGR
jgi:putative NADPH-quinone reductase